MQSVLEQLYRRRFGLDPSTVTPMRPHASGRALFRLSRGTHSVVGAYYDAVPENRAFVAFARHFFAYGLPVPEVYAVSDDERAYLVEDLGDETLFDRLTTARTENDPFPLELHAIYARCLDDLIEFQIGAGRGVDYSYCYQGPRYDDRAMHGDVAYFEQEFLGRLAHGSAQRGVGDELRGLVDVLREAPDGYFLYRDFQSRNIMLRGDRPHYIDFQSGRRGALQYDLVSLLYQAQAQIPECAREQLLGQYLWQLDRRYGIRPVDFRPLYRGFTVLRLVQVLGAYGSLGLGAGKEYFRQGIPLALRALLDAVQYPDLPVRLTALHELTQRLIESPGI